MTARDDYAKLNANTSGPHHQGETSQQAQQALDEIDTLRALLDAKIETLGPLTGLNAVVMRGVSQADFREIGRTWMDALAGRAQRAGLTGMAADVMPLLVLLNDDQTMEQVSESAMNQCGWFRHPLHQHGFPTPPEEAHHG